MFIKKIESRWIRFWMRHAGLSRTGRLAAYLVSWFSPSYKNRIYLANFNPHGYISSSAAISHPNLSLGKNIYIGDRVVIYQAKDGGEVKCDDRVHFYSDIIVETGEGGYVHIGSDTHIQPRCSISAYKGPISIGRRVEIAPNCAFYPYDHGMAPDEPIRTQPLQTKGGIVVGDDSWLGFGVIVLDGVRIGNGAVIGAGSVVTKDIPDNAIAVGVPARVVKMRVDVKK